MAKKSSAKSANPQKNTKIAFHYQKGPDFRTIHCDGAVGGLTPRGILHVAFFSERNAIPKKTVQELSETNVLGPEIESERETIGGVVRQMEVDLFMGEDTARNLRDWLNTRLAEFERIRKIKTASAELARPGNASSKGKH